MNIDHESAYEVLEPRNVDHIVLQFYEYVLFSRFFFLLFLPRIMSNNSFEITILSILLLTTRKPVLDHRLRHYFLTVYSYHKHFISIFRNHIEIVACIGIYHYLEFKFFSLLIGLYALFVHVHFAVVCVCVTLCKCMEIDFMFYS